MTPALRAHPRSLNALRLQRNDPLQVVRVINSVRHWRQCSIRLTKPDANVTLLEFTFPHISRSRETPSVLNALDGTVPEVFNCDRLTITTPSHSHTVQDPRSVLDPDANSLTFPLTSVPAVSPNQSSIALYNYHNTFVPSRLSNAHAFSEALLSSTVVGCGSPALAPLRVTFSLLSHGHTTITRRAHNQRTLDALPAGAKIHRTRRELDHGIVADLLLWESTSRKSITKLQVFDGGIPATPPPTGAKYLLGALADTLNPHPRHRLSHSLDVYSPREMLQLDDRGQVIESESWSQVSHSVRTWLRNEGRASGAISLRDHIQDQHSARAAERIAIRAERLTHAPFVFLNGRPILHAPRSENDVLALYFKLEGADALPLTQCHVLEHTPRQDTDSIGHFQIVPHDVPKRYAPIEFEHEFRNFIRHGHSGHHVDLIICWSASPTDPLHDTGVQWLKQYAVEDPPKSIPVLILSRIPDLLVQPMEQSLG